MHKRWMKWLRVSCAALGAGAIVPACGVGSAAQFVARLNPCGTVLNCDPVAYQFIKSGYQGPGADPNVDLACTYPPYCNYTGTLPDPFSPPATGYVGPVP